MKLKPKLNYEAIEMNSSTIIALDECGLAPGQILADGVRQWRAECGVGQFKIGANVMRGQKLDMEIIAAQDRFFQPFAKYPPMNWLGVLFVDQDGVLSSILFKKESRANFLEMLRQVKLANRSVLGSVIRASLSQRAGQGKDDKGNIIAVTYYAVEFELLEKPAQYAEAISEFRQAVDYCGMLEFQDLQPPAIGGTQAMIAA